MPDRRSDQVALVQLTLAKLREYTREPEALFWTFVFPVLMALALGIAFRTERAGPIRVGVEATGGSPAPAAVLEQATGFAVQLLPDDAIDRALRDGEVDVVVRPGSPPVYRYDPTRPESRLARLAVDGALQRAAGRADRFTAVDQAVVTPGSRYIDWLVPGLLGLTVMATSLWSIGFSIVQMRTRKLLKRLVATPMRRRDFLMAQFGARLLFLLPETASLVLFAWLVFGVEIRGSPAVFGFVVLVGALSFSGLGVLVASRARTVEAVSGLLNVTMLPMWVLSGIFFSTTHFPTAMQPFIKVIPLTALNDALRAVMLEGAGLTRVTVELGILGVWGLAGFAVALKTFRWL